MINHRGHVTQPVAGNLKNRGQVLGTTCDRPAAEVRFLAGKGVEALSHLLRHVIIELVGAARASGPFAVHPQLLEIPSPVLHLRHRGGPNAVGRRFPAGNGPTAGEQRFGAWRSLVTDRAGFSAAILGKELDWCGQRVGARRKLDPDRRIAEAAFLEPADRIASTRQRSERAVCSSRVGPGRPPRPRVVAVRRDVHYDRRSGFGLV